MISNTNNNKIHLFLSGRYYLNLLLNPKLPPPPILRKLKYLYLKNLYIKKRFNPTKNLILELIGII